MLVLMQSGSRLGSVVDFPPHEARAMLADGRARLPEADAPVITSRVESRTDRGFPTDKRRKVR